MTGSGAVPITDNKIRLLDSIGAQLVFDQQINGAANFSFTADVTGTFFLEATDREANDTGDYTVSINADDTITNNFATTAQVLAPGGTLNSAIDVIGDVDVIKTTLEAGISYGFTMQGDGGSPITDTKIRLLDNAGGQLVVNQTINGPSGFSVTSATLADFFVEVSERETNEAGGYQLDINNNDTIKNDITTAQVLAPGGVLNSAIDVVTDVDVIKTTLQA